MRFGNVLMFRRAVFYNFICLYVALLFYYRNGLFSGFFVVQSYKKPVLYNFMGGFGAGLHIFRIISEGAYGVAQSRNKHKRAQMFHAAPFVEKYP